MFDNKLAKLHSAASYARAERRWTQRSDAAPRRAYNRASRRTERFEIEAGLELIEALQTDREAMWDTFDAEAQHVGECQALVDEE